jgi:sugar diacid utilization regulator/GAF domain-containing protein
MGDDRDVPRDEIKAGSPPGSQRSEVDAAAAFEAWAAVSRTMLEDRNLEETLDLIASTAADLTGQAFAAVLLVSADRSQLEIRGSHGLSESYIDRLNNEMPLLLDSASGPNIAGQRAFRTGRPTVLHFDSEDGMVWPWSSLAQQEGFVSVASAPLSIQGRQLGALNVYGREHTDFSRSQMTLLEALATEAAAAIQIVEMRAMQKVTIRELRQSDRMQQTLAKVALGDEGLDPITATLAKLTGLGIAVEDCVTGGTLSRAGLSDASIEQLELARAGLESGPDAGPGRADLRIDPDTLITREPVSLGTETVAQLWTYSSALELTEVQRRVLKRGAVIIALELLKQRDAREAEWRVRGELLDELMTASVDDEDRVYERARALGHDLEVPHTPIVVRPDVLPESPGGKGGEVEGGQGLRRIVAIAYAVAGSQVPKPLVGTFAGAVVVIWRGEDRAPTEIADAIRRYVSARTSETVSVCIGQSGETMGAHRRSIRLALGAIRLLQSSGGTDRLVSLDELGIFRVLLAVDDEQLLRETSRQVLGPILDYDKARNGAMFETLTTFIEQEMNVAETARVLHLHTNSLNYRLRRIEEILAVRLRNPDDLVRVNFALAIHKLTPTPE